MAILSSTPGQAKPKATTINKGIMTAKDQTNTKSTKLPQWEKYILIRQDMSRCSV